MKQAFALVILVMAGLLASHLGLGYTITHQIAFGAVTVIALVIAVTFLWLWRVRATPLALGMVFSWTGGALILGWWWINQLLGRPEAMRDSPILFVFLAFYIGGAILHFVVIQGTVHLPVRLYAGLATVAVALPSLLIALR